MRVAVLDIALLPHSFKHNLDPSGGKSSGRLSYVFDISFETVDRRIGIQKVEVIGIRKDRPLNHLENR